MAHFYHSSAKILIVMKAGVVVFGVCCLLTSVGYSQKPTVVIENDPGWHKIGQITASFKMDNESIIVYGRDEFVKIRLKVLDAPILIDQIHLFYEEGSTQEIEIGMELQAGGTTPALDLEGTNKELDKVVFTYKTLPNYQGDRATVELYGLKTREDRTDAFRDDNDDKIEADMEEQANEYDDEADTRDVREDVKQEGREAREKAREVSDDIEQRADETGKDISEAAGNAAAYIKDKVYVDKMGPEGQTIYIDKHSRYYYVADDGKKVFLSKSQLKDKPDQD